MASTSDGHPTDFFPWDHLPFDLQELILLLLPISTLLRCKTVSRNFLAIVRSQSFRSSYSNLRRRRRFGHREDLLLLLYSDYDRPDLSAAYHPSARRWLPFPFPPAVSHVCASGSSLALVNTNLGEEIVVDFFSRKITPIAPLLRPTGGHPYVLALIEDEAPADYRIVAVSTGPDAVHSQVYDSRSCRWELKGQLPGVYAMLGNATFLDGLLFVLSGLPDRLFTFDPTTGIWALVDVALPPAIACSHILVFDRKLFLVGGIEEEMAIARVGIWELDQLQKEWSIVGFMPEEFFVGFSRRQLQHFLTVDGMGFICFCTGWQVSYVMFDLLTRRWWQQPECDLIPKGSRHWWWLAVELQPELLK